MRPADLTMQAQLKKAVNSAIPPLYVQVREIVRERIEDGTYKNRLPTEYELSLEFDVSYNTVRRALRFLKHEGLLTAKPNRGTFVSRNVRAPRGWNGAGE